MSDLGRKNVSDKVSEAITPDNQKSTLEKTKETVTDRVDEFAGKEHPRRPKVIWKKPFLTRFNLVTKMPRKLLTRTKPL